jgi:hypothetical protein
MKISDLTAELARYKKAVDKLRLFMDDPIMESNGYIWSRLRDIHKIARQAGKTNE